MRLEHHLVGGYVRYISPHIIIIIIIICFFKAILETSLCISDRLPAGYASNNID